MKSKIIPTGLQVQSSKVAVIQSLSFVYKGFKDFKLGANKCK